MKLFGSMETPHAAAAFPDSQESTANCDIANENSESDEPEAFKEYPMIPQSGIATRRTGWPKYTKNAKMRLTNCHKARIAASMYLRNNRLCCSTVSKTPLLIVSDKQMGTATIAFVILLHFDGLGPEDEGGVCSVREFELM